MKNEEHLAANQLQSVLSYEKMTTTEKDAMNTTTLRYCISPPALLCARLAHFEERSKRDFPLVFESTSSFSLAFKCF